MANQLDNLTDETFGFLSVVERAPNDVYDNVWWKCRCVCGAFKLMRASQLRSGKFFYCGKTECRFWSKVYRSSDDACWEWVAGTNDAGYGIFRHQGKNVRAHHFSWLLKYGEVIDQDKMLLHSCDNPTCVNPAHLSVGTHVDNMTDMAKRGRAKVAKVFLLPYAKKRMVEEYRRGGLSHSDMASKYGVSIQTVRRTLRRASSGGK